MWYLLLNDIKVIVYKYLHRSQLTLCFQEINKYLIWDDDVHCYRDVKSYATGLYFASANYRNVYLQSYEERWCDIWDIRRIWIGYRVKGDIMVPKNYYKNELLGRVINQR